MQLPFDGEHSYGLKGFVHDICAKCFILFRYEPDEEGEHLGTAGAGDGRMELRSGMRLPDNTTAEDSDNGRSSDSG